MAWNAGGGMSKGFTFLDLLKERDQSCVRCGYCCKKATCALGVAKGSPLGEKCIFLKGRGPGSYRCQVIVDDPSLGPQVAIGAGCSSTIGNTVRNKVIQKRNAKTN